MAASRLVMQEWAEGYREVLDKSGVTRDAHKGYVDDGRQISDMMIMGSRYEKSRKRFIWREDWQREDELENLPDEVRMGRICLDAMNDVSQDLTFTVETVHDFANKRLATLDFEAEVIDCQTHGCKQIIYSYYEKSMKTSLVIAESSAMGEHQKFSILTNEVIRRLSNTSKEIKSEERVAIINTLTRQLKNSGYGRKKAREIIVCGLLGLERKKARRKRTGENFR